MSIKNPKETIELRKQLRRKMTEAENILWQHLRKKQLCEVRVRRQYGIGPFVLDFYIPKINLAIEVDGKIHLNKKVAEKDVNKDAFLMKNGAKVLRIKNEEILNNLNNVLLNLRKLVEHELNNRPPLSPPATGGGRVG